MKLLKKTSERRGSLGFLGRFKPLLLLMLLCILMIPVQEAHAAFPTVQATNTSATTTAGTSHTVNLPSGIQSGDLLIALFSGLSTTAAVDVNWPSGWTEFFEQDATITPSLVVAGAYRRADESEGASITVTTNVSVRAAHNTYRISGAANPATQAPQATAISYTTTGTGINPPSLTPTGGAKDYLWLAVAGWRDAATTITMSTDPGSYTNAIEASSTGGTSGTKLRSLRRQLNATSEDPSTFTLSANSLRRIGVTIAVHPTASTLTLDNHPSGQTDKFTNTSSVTDVLFRFNLTKVGTVTVDNLRVNFTTTGGVAANGDVTACELWEDVDNDGVVDSPGDNMIQGSVTPSGGVITFTSDFSPSTSGTNYLVRATVSNLASGDTTTISVGTADIDVDVGVTESGSITNAIHLQDSDQVTKRWGENSNCDYTGVTQDTFLDSSSTTFEEGGCYGAYAVRVGYRTDSGTRAMRALIKFNFSNIPITDPNQIVSAYLKMNVDFVSSGSTINFDAYRVLKTWNGGDTCHDLAESGETTWQYQIYSTTAWSTAGCDGSGSDRASTSAGTFSVSTTGSKSWDVTQSARDMFASGNYYGWVLKSQSESGINWFSFYSSEDTTAANRPYLEITYAPATGGQFVYRKLITIDKTKLGSSCSADFYDFPVLIKISGDNNLKTVANGGRVYDPQGDDIVFREYDVGDYGRKGLRHEIEKYDGSTGDLVAWVKVPTVYKDSDTKIYMYYGNSKISSSTADAANVWDLNFKAVWHLKEYPTVTNCPTNKEICDSTSNSLHGDMNGSMASGDQVPAQVNGGLDFDGSDDYFDHGDVMNSISVPFTGEAWVYRRDSPETCENEVIFASDDGSTYYGFWFFFEGCSYELAVTYGDGNGAGSGYRRSKHASVSISQTTWTHVAVVVRGATDMSLYVNGSEVSGTYSGTGGVMVHSSDPARIGTRYGDPLNSRFNGIIDEVRISDMDRGACWIGTSYNNQYSPSTFYSVGSEQNPAPTAITLSAFTATEYEDGVLLEWKTGHEMDNLGFHIYREENGELYRLTPEPVAGSAFHAGSGTSLRAGRQYVWLDTSAMADVEGPLTLKDQPSASRTVPQVAGLEANNSSASSEAHEPNMVQGEALLERSAPRAQRSVIQYWLKDLDLSGKETMHGPVVPVVSQGPLPEKVKPELLSEVGQRLQEKYEEYWKAQELRERLQLAPEVRGALRVRSLRTGNEVPSRSGPTGLEGRGFHRQPDLAANEVQRYLAGKPGVKLFVREEGWYRVSQPELVAAGLSRSVRPEYLQLYMDGREQPIRVVGGKNGRFGPGDAVEFYGTGVDTLLTDTRVYWLIGGLRVGQRIEEHWGGGGLSGGSSFLHTVERKDRTIYISALKNGEESNFFGAVVAKMPVNQVLRLSHLDPAPSGEAILEVSLQGVTDASHRVRVGLNGSEVGEVVFEKKSKGLMRWAISQSWLHEGENLVSLVAEGGAMDVSLVDYIRLSYWHTYTADSDSSKFTAQGGRQVTLGGFSSPKIRVIDITDSEAFLEVKGIVNRQGLGYSVSLRVPGTGQRTLMAFTEGRLKSPKGVLANKISSWHERGQGYDLVILSHKDFLGSLEPLKRLRESQGLRVTLVDVEDVYDEFSFGVKSPQAIKDFLALTRANWRKPPRFVLLVGDASFDSRNYYGFGDFDYVPTKLIDTVYLETASDDWFVDFNGDGLPEMALGRLPVHTVEEANIVVSKIVGYERSTPLKEALLVGDRKGENDLDFEAASEEVGELLPSNILVRKIFRADFGSNTDAKNELLRDLNLGPLLVNFIGHGTVWGWNGDLLSTGDTDGLTNGLRLPFVISMTCFNGWFHDPYYDSLAEALLKAKGGGAVAVWTSSGMTEPDKQLIMNKELIRLLFGRDAITLGEATAKAKASVSDQDVRKTWILFGDPATRLRQ